MWDRIRTLVHTLTRVGMVLLLVAKPVGGYPALHYAHGTRTVQESQVSHHCECFSGRVID
jgi:hypothetical protein